MCHTIKNEKNTFFFFAFFSFLCNKIILKRTNFLIEATRSHCESPLVALHRQTPLSHQPGRLFDGCQQRWQACAATVMLYMKHRIFRMYGRHCKKRSTQQTALRFSMNFHQFCKYFFYFIHFFLICPLLILCLHTLVLTYFIQGLGAAKNFDVMSVGQVPNELFVNFMRHSTPAYVRSAFYDLLLA